MGGLISNFCPRALWAITALGLLVFSSGCAKYENSEGEELVTECILPSDQENSLQGKWNTTPIKVSFRSGDFNSGETSDIEAAAGTWNKFFNASKGLQIFDAAGHTSNLNQTLPNCAANTLSDGTVLYKRTSSWTKSPAAVAVTTFCVRAGAGGGLNEIFNGIMEFNYQNFFTASTGRFPDLQSIALHELGHLLGLDHSCGDLRTGKPNAACPDAGADPFHFLVLSVMFPQVFFDSSGAGEVKRSLTANDQGRANCIY